MPYLTENGVVQFRRDTAKVYAFTVVKVSVSGSNLKPIIAALDHYRRVRSFGDAETLRALCSIVSQCRKWLRLKAAKINAAAAAPGEQTVIKRKNAVTALENEALTELRRSLAGHGQGLADAITAYETRKDARRRAGVITLAPGYVNERAAYLSFAKKKSVSGTQVRELLEGNSTRTGLQLPAKADAKFNAKFRSKAGEDEDAYFKTLTLKDWEDIEKIAHDVEGHQIEVRYFNKFDRLQRMLEPDGRGGLQFCSGLDAATHHRLGDPWAMDEWGNLYTSPEEKGVYSIFNHSSFAAGDLVVCAGNMIINSNGKIVRIDNVSGHYQPDPERLRAAVEILRDEYLCDFSNAEIWASAKVGGAMRMWVYSRNVDHRTVLVPKTADDFIDRSTDSQNQRWFGT